MYLRTLVLLSLSLLYKRAYSREYDVVVYTSTPAGIASAIAAKVSGAQKVLLLEPTAYVGGMASPGGIGLRDCKTPAIRTNNSTQYEWAIRNGLYYGCDYPVWQPDHWVGEMNFKKMLSDYGVELALKTNFKEGSAGVVTEVDQFSELRRVTTLLLENGEAVKAKYFIDASYEGELMMATGHVSFTYGREGRDKYNESLAGVTNHSDSKFPLPVHPYTNVIGLKKKEQRVDYVQDNPDPRTMVGQPDKNLIAYSFRPCITENPNNSVPFPKPQGYNPKDFELSRRLLLDELAAVPEKDPTPPWDNLEYNNGKYPVEIVNATKYDACCGLSSVGIDAVGLAVDYPIANRTERKRIYDAHKYYVQGLMWFWTHDIAVPDHMRENNNKLGLCKDEWPENGHFPPQLYVREAARIVGDRVYTQNDRVPYNATNGCLEDSIAVAAWGIDIHDIQRVVVNDSKTGQPMVFNEGLTSFDFGGNFPFEIPFYIVLPKRQEIVNLAVPNCPSVSHVAFAAVRVEPTLWQMGQAAGTAAGLGVKQGGGIPLQDMSVQTIQSHLIKQGAFVHWPPRDKC